MVIRIYLVLALAVAPGVAWADAGEASIDVHPIGGLAVLDDDAAPGQSDQSYLAGAAARMSYATHDRFAYRLELAAARSGLASYQGVDWDGAMGELYRVSELARAQVGIELRLGARYIPIVHMAVGGLARAAGPSSLRLADGTVIAGPGASWSWALTVSGGLGFEYRVNAQWIAGVSASAIRAFPVFPLGGAQFQSIEGGFHVSYFWYPNL